MRKAAWVPVATGILLLAGLFLVRRPDGASRPDAIAPKIAPQEIAPPASPKSIVAPPSPPEPTPAQPAEKADANHPRRPIVRIRKGEPIPELFPHQEERERLVKLAAQGDPAALPSITSALKHADPTVRATAVQALIRLGNTQAIPALREAAEHAADADEAAVMREAADFLALPDVR